MNDITLEKLNDWKDKCNIENPISHDLDRKRWFDFVINASKDAKRPSPEELLHILEDEKKLSPNAIGKAVCYYEYGLDLLITAYNK